MNPIDRIIPHSISHHNPEEASSKILFELPETLKAEKPSTNTFAITWLIHTLAPDIKLLPKDVERDFSTVYFLLIAEAIGKTPFARF